MEDIPEDARKLIDEFNAQQNSTNESGGSPESRKNKILKKIIESVVRGGKLLTPREAFELAELMGFQIHQGKKHAMIIGPNGKQLAIPRGPVQEKTLSKGIQTKFLKTLGLKGDNDIV